MSFEETETASNLLVQKQAESREQLRLCNRYRSLYRLTTGYKKTVPITAMEDSPINHAQLVKSLIHCTNFAAIKHKDQRRKDIGKTPYINHPIGVAQILACEANVTNKDVILAALLHDTVEDTATTFEEIEAEFGKTVRDIVSEVTDDKSLPKEKRKMLQIEHAKCSSHEAKLVKLADKLYNLRDLQKQTPEGWTKERVQEYFKWSRKVCEGLVGTNEYLEKEVDALLRKMDA